MIRTVVIILTTVLSAFGDQLNIEGIKIESTGTNQWLFLSNGIIIIPPFEFPSEAQGANGLSGGVYFTSKGNVGLDNGPHYILNIIHRGVGGGQLLISHQSIDLEEQSVGEIVLGNDISTGGIIRVRFCDFGGQNLRTNVPGHAHPIVFDGRVKLKDGSIHSSQAAIIEYHGGGPDEASQGSLRGWGPAGRGEIAFYTLAPWSDTAERLVGGVEMGRMTTNGWNLYGQVQITNLQTGGVTTNWTIPGLGTLCITNGLLMKVK